MRIFAFEGPYEVYACESITAGEAYFEAVDVEKDDFAFFGDDGTVIRPSVRDSRVVLTPTGENRLGELQERLRTYLVQPQVALESKFVDQPATLAALLIERETWRSPKWWRSRRPT